MFEGFSVLHDDENVLIVNKNCGFAVIPGRGISDDIVIVKLIEKQLGIHCFVVHRIDLETSGIVLFAKIPVHIVISVCSLEQSGRKVISGACSGNG
jgi:23S rRNA-/tRNA-specific pseudouridylate synthase